LFLEKKVIIFLEQCLLKNDNLKVFLQNVYRKFSVHAKTAKEVGRGKVEISNENPKKIIGVVSEI